MKKFMLAAGFILTLSPLYSNANAIEPKKKVVTKPVTAVPIDEKEFEKHIKEKMRRAKRICNNAATFLKEHNIGKACRSFETETKWHQGDLFVSVFSENGDCYVHDDQVWMIWDKVGVPEVIDKDAGGRSRDFIREMLSTGQEGGWVSYEWEFAARYSYVRTVRKLGKTYIVAVGFFPDSPRFMVQQMVQAAIRYGEEFGPERLFQEISNPKGLFTKGELYLWAYDMKGKVYAHPNIGFIGQTRLDWKDAKGRYRNKIMIEKAQRNGRGWVEYEENGVEKIAYFQTLTARERGDVRKAYIIGGGFYPTVDDDMVRNFVAKASNYLRANGPEITFRDITSYSGGFNKGPLRIFVYNLEGRMLADGANPQLIGQMLIDSKDAEGKPITKGILDLVKSEGRGWYTFLDNNAYKSVYAELVEIQDGKFVVGTGYWPTSKEHTARSLAEKAVDQLEKHGTVETLRLFTEKNNTYLRGDLFVQVFSEDGICLASGLDLDRIWEDTTNNLDEQGYPIFDKIKATALQGGGWIDLQRSYGTYRAFVKLVSKPLPIEENEKSKKAKSAREEEQERKDAAPGIETEKAVSDEKAVAANNKKDEQAIQEIGKAPDAEPPALSEAASKKRTAEKESERKQRTKDKAKKDRREAQYEELMREPPTLKRGIVHGPQIKRKIRKGFESYIILVGYYL